MQDTRRLVIPAWKKVEGNIVPVAGHLIGAGNNSVLALHRRVQGDLVRQMTRRATGRFVWWPNMDREPGSFTPPCTRQYIRQIGRAIAKVEASAARKQARAEKRKRH